MSESSSIGFLTTEAPILDIVTALKLGISAALNASSTGVPAQGLLDSGTTMIDTGQAFLEASTLLPRLSNLQLNHSHDTVHSSQSHEGQGSLRRGSGLIGQNNTNSSDAGGNEDNKWNLTVYSEEHMIVTSIILGLFVLLCIIGNCFVIAAVMLERSLHNVANYLILSLAVADLLVAVLVMPLSVVSEISKYWFLHQSVCDIWISVDVLCCTASILHLVAIAMDRYWAVTSIQYIRNRSARRISLMIAVVWIVALFISIPPLFGWKNSDLNVQNTGVCMISQDKGYTIFSTVGAFYLPMAVMMIIYARIWQVARARIRKDKFPTTKAPTKKTEETTLVASPKTEYSIVSDSNGCSTPRGASEEKKRRAPFKSYGCSPRPERKKNRNKKQHSSAEPSSSAVDSEISGGLSKANSSFDKSATGNGIQMKEIEPDAFTNGYNDEAAIAMLEKQSTNGKKVSTNETGCYSKTREKLELKRERKAARTLAFITGAFLLCWLPFFIIALISPFFDVNQFPTELLSFVLWLGYFNSLLNPIIYTIFSPEFRSAFQKILFGKYRNRYR